MIDMEGLLREAGRLLLSFEELTVKTKEGHANYVTQADVAVQRFLLEGFSGLLPGARFLAEEEGRGDTELTDAPTFIIDPIDGTTNFFRRRRASCISAALAVGGRVVQGAIYDPYRDEMYTAALGEGAYCNGVRLRVSRLPLERALIELGTAPYDADMMALTAASVAMLLPAAGDLRRSGSAALDLCNVAAGRSEALFEWRLRPWDYAAGQLLVTEAGGCSGCITGGETALDRPCAFIAANAECFEALRERLMAVRDSL